MSLKYLLQRKICHYISINKFDAVKKILESNESDEIIKYLNKYLTKFVAVSLRQQKLEIVQFLLDHGANLLESLEYLKKNHYKSPKIEILQFLFELNVDIQLLGKLFMKGYVYNEKVNCIQFLFDHGFMLESILDQDFLFVESIRIQNMSIIKIFIENGYRYTKKDFTGIYFRIKMDLIKFLMEYDADLSELCENLLSISTFYGEFDVVKFLFDNVHQVNHYVTPDIFRISVSREHYKITKFFLENGYQFNGSNTIDADSFEMCCQYNLKMAKHLYSLDGNIHFKMEVFTDCCSDGNIEAIEFLHQISNGQIDIHAKNEKNFRRACASGKLKMIKFLLSLDDNINIHTKNEQSFRTACENGDLRIAKYLLSLEPMHGKIDIHAKNNSAFRRSCEIGHFEISKFLYDLYDDKNINVCDCNLFSNVCEAGHIEIAKWLYELNPTLHNSEFEIAFKKSALIHNIKMIKWLSTIDQINTNSVLIDIFKKIYTTTVKYPSTHKMIKWFYQYFLDHNIKINYQPIFKWCCRRKRFKTAKWLYQLHQNEINIHADSDYIFQICCMDSGIEMAQWLASIYDRYMVKVIDNTIVDWEVY